MPARLPRILVPLLLAVVALSSAGCATVDGLRGPTGDPRVAATVDGVDITIEELEERLGAAPAEPQPGEDPAAQQSSVVTQLVQETLLRSAAEEQGVEVTEEDLAATREALVQQFGGEEGLTQQLQQAGVTEDEFQTILEVQTLQSLLNESVSAGVEVTDAEVEEYYASAAGPFGPQSAELRQLVVESEAAGEAAVARVEGGEDFTAVAADVSTDPSGPAGVELGEVARDGIPPQFVEAIFSAEPGAVVGPIEAGPDAFVVLQVVALGEPQEQPPFEEVQDQVRQQLVALRQEQEVTAYFTELFDADVDVNPRFGVWDPTAQQVADIGPLGRTELEQAEGALGELPPGGAPGQGAPAGG